MAYVGRSPRYGFLEGQTATFDGSTTTVTLQRNVSSTDAIDVYIDNVHQEPDVAYTLSSGGNSITFTGTPENGAVLYIRFHGISFDTTRAYRLENSDGGSTATLGDDDSFTLSLDGTTALSATSSGVTIANLTVTGTTTTVNSTDLNIGDNKITLNSDLASDTAPTENAGIVVNRGSSTDVEFVWREDIDRWSTDNAIRSYSKFETIVSGSFPTISADTTAVFANSATNESSYISIIGNSGAYSGIYFGDENTESAGYLRLNHTSDILETTKPLHTTASYIKVGDASANGYETSLGHNALTFNRSGASYIDQAQSSGSLAIRFGSTYVTPISINTDGTTFNKNINMSAGNIQVGGTTVIDSNRNITAPNVTISSDNSNAFTFTRSATSKVTLGFGTSNQDIASTGPLSVKPDGTTVNKYTFGASTLTLNGPNLDLGGGEIDQSKSSNGSFINQFENTNTGTSAYTETQWINSTSQLRVGTSLNYADPWQGAWVYADTQDLMLKAGGSGKAIEFYAGNVNDIRARVTSTGIHVGSNTDTYFDEVASGAVGVRLTTSGEIDVARSGAAPLNVNRLDSAGAIANFKYNGDTVADINQAGTMSLDGSLHVGNNVTVAGDFNTDIVVKLSNYNTPAFTIQRYNNAALDLFAFGEYDGGTGTPWGGSSWGAAVIHTHNRNMVFSTASSDFTDLVNGDAAMFIGYDDQIGIGNTDPAARLHVTHNDTWTFLLERTGGTPHMQFRNSSDGGNYSFIWSEYGSGFKWGQRLADGSNETVYLQSNGDGQLTTNDYFTVSHWHGTPLSNTYTGTQSYVAEGGDFLRLHNSADPTAGPQYAGIWFQTPQWTGTSGTGRPVRIGGKSVERNYSADFFVQTRGTNAQMRTRMTVGEEGVMRDYTGNTSSNYKWWTPTADHYQVREYDFGNRLYIKKDVSASGYANVVWLNRYLPAEFDMTFELKGGQPSSTYRHFGIVLNGNGVANVSQWDYIVLRQHSSNSNLNTIRWDDAGVTRNNVEGSSNPNFFDGNKRRVRIEKRASSLRCEVASLGQSPYVWGTHTGLGFTATEGGFTGFSIYEPGASDTWVEIGNLTITEV